MTSRVTPEGLSALSRTAYAEPAQAVATQLDVAPDQGLSARDATQRRVRFGPNQLKRQERSLLAILAHQFRSLIVWLLAFAAVVSFAFGDLSDGIAIIAVLILNTCIGFFTELSAARKMEALLRITQVETRVRRDGRVRIIHAAEIVPGDVVLLAAGDVVAADMRLTEVSNLDIDESALTGESLAVTKSPDPVESDAVIGDRSCMAYSGTAVTKGEAEGVVIATGMQTELGRITGLAQDAEAEVTPLEHRLDRLGHRLVWLTLALASLTTLTGVMRGYDPFDMLQTGIALAVAAIPEGLPVVATLSLARGVWKMARQNALITRLSSVETLGASTIVLTDKTGTLTENRMSVIRYMFPDGDIDMGSDSVDPGAATPLRRALEIGALCTTAELADGSGERPLGDPMELALLEAARKGGIEHDDALTAFPLVTKHAFDPDLQMMATVHDDGGTLVAAVKGAPERVMAICTSEMTAQGLRPLDTAARDRWAARLDDATRDGLRLLALASGHPASADSDPYRDLALVGLVCLVDPLRSDVPEAIRASRAAGLRVVMVTGDHANTAARIARNAGLSEDEPTVIEGRALARDTPEDDTRRAQILKADVFARVAPDTKLALVSLYQDAGHVVAMTGDGVNDAPALKKADIGIAMGQRGTEVAREAADMILKDDAFGTIIEAMRQGRNIFDNIRRFVVYLLSCNLSEVLVVGLAVGMGLPAPLLPLQILFLNLVTDIFPAFALGLGPGDPTVMDRPPRDPKEPLVDRPQWLQIAFLGGAITVATLAAFALAIFWLGLDGDRAVTVAFLTLALAQLVNVFNVRNPARPVLVNEVTRNPFVWGAIALCVAMIAATIWVPGLSQILRLPHPGGPGLALAGALSVFPLLAGQIFIAWRLPRLTAAKRGHRPTS